MHWIDEKLRYLEPVIGTEKALKLRQAYAAMDSKGDRYELECYIDHLVSTQVKKTM